MKLWLDFLGKRFFDQGYLNAYIDQGIKTCDDLDLEDNENWFLPSLKEYNGPTMNAIFEGPP